ncbi:MAG TPA: carbon monoxide dehydrogenase subunit G [Thermomicrobiaceae bacterium]|nr:carbon monoxide dehydrogenase subunit G [Thermomicrobiaceae bacterium]
MKISGTYEMKAPRDAVWGKLIDPDSIAGCLPGVEKLEKIGDNDYSMAMALSIGPIRGTFTGKVALANLNPPNDYQMQVEGSGGPGFVKGTGTVRLTDSEDNTTHIAYEGDVTVGGPVGSVAQRMLGGVAKRMVDQFFGCIEGQFAGS